MPANDLTLRQNYVFTGWAHNAKGTTYLVEGEVAYMNVVAHTYGNAYLFNAEGCLVAGAGLYRYVTAEGVVEYYYFDEGSYIAVKNTSMWIENVNGLLPVWEYKFDANGVIEHHEDTSLNGIQKIEGVKYYFIDGVKAYMGLIQVDGDYYYVRSNGQLVVNCTYWISKTNDLMKEKAYQFDAEGKMIIGDHPAVKNGIVAEEGSLFYYENGERVYAGLIEIDGHYYYVKTNCEVVHGGNYWITKTNGIMKQGKYYFNEQGQLGDEPDELKKNGLFEEDGKLYYYEAGIRTYAGLIEIDGHYYYIKSGCYAVTDGTYWVTKTNGIMKAGNYTFDAQGRMVIKEEEPGFTGLKTEGDKIFYYENGIRTYAGLIKIDGYYYYIKSNCEAVKGGEFWITKTNGIVKEGRYTFDEQGRMVTE